MMLRCRRHRVAAAAAAPWTRALCVRSRLLCTTSNTSTGTSSAWSPAEATAATNGRLPWSRLTATQRELVARSSRGHVSVVGGYAAGKTTAAAERVLWLHDHHQQQQRPQDRRVLVLCGRPTESATLARYLDKATSFYALERKGHRVAGVMEWAQQTLEELNHTTEGGKRMFSFGKMTAFLMHHAKELPLKAFHQRLATSSSMQLRRSVADMLRFFTMLEAHGVTTDSYEEYASTLADVHHMELAQAYTAYRELQQKHEVSSWDGLVLDLHQLLAQDPHCLSVVTSEFTDLVVDDLDQMSPAMVQLISLLIQQPHLESSTSFSHSTQDLCPRTSQLNDLLVQQQPAAALIHLPIQGDHSTQPSRDREAIRTLLQPSSILPPTAASTPESVPVTSLEFDTFVDEAAAIARLVHQKLSSSTQRPRITVFCTTSSDAHYIRNVLLDHNVPVDGHTRPHPQTASTTSSGGRRHLFDEPVVDALCSFLVALWMPSDNKHLYNVLRSDLIAFPPEFLSTVMEKQHRHASHLSVVDVLTTFVDANGHKTPSTAAVVDAGDSTDPEDPVAAAVATASLFLSIVDDARTQCHSKSVHDLVHLFLDRTGHLARLVDPQTPVDARQAIALAALLKEIDAAQRIVASVHVPFVVPYLVQLESARVAFLSDNDQLDEVVEDQQLLWPGESSRRGRGVRVVPLTRYEVDQLETQEEEDGEDDGDDELVVLMAMRDSKFPGRLKRITWPLPRELLCAPLPIQTRQELVDETDRLLYDALVQRNPKEIVVSYAKLAAVAAKKPETISRLLLPLWRQPQPAATLSSTPSSTPSTTGSSSTRPCTPPSTSSTAESSSTPSTAGSSSTSSTPSTLSTQPTTYEPSHLSYSQITEYNRCPHKYYLSRVVGLRAFDDSPPLAMMFGSAVHEAIAAYALFLQDRPSGSGSGQGGPLSAQEQEEVEVEAHAQAALQSAWQPQGFLSKEQEQFFWKRAQSTLHGFIQRSSSSSSETTILHVEKEFECRLGDKNGVSVRGVWDRIDRTSNGVVIREFKTNPSAQKRPKLDAAAAESLQLQLYLVAYEQIYGETPYGATLEVLGPQQCDEGEAVGTSGVGFVAFSPEMRGQVADAVDETIHAIRRGEFPPKPSYMECAMCPFASSACHVVAHENEGVETLSATSAV